MHLLDSISTLDPVSTAPRPRARRAEAPGTANEEPIRALPRWARPQSADPGAAIFAAGAGLALFDARPARVSSAAKAASRSSPAACVNGSRSRPPNLRDAGAATRGRGRLARRRTSSGRRRDEPGRSAASLVPALRRHCPPASTRRRARAELLGLRETIDASALAAAAATAPDPLMAAARASAAAMKLCARRRRRNLRLRRRRSRFGEPSGLGAADPLLAVAILHPSLRRGAGAGKKGKGGRPRPTDDDWPVRSRAPMASRSSTPMRSPSIWRGVRKSFLLSRRSCARRAPDASSTCCSPTTPSRPPPPRPAPASPIGPRAVSSTGSSRWAPCANSPDATLSGSMAYEPRQRRPSRPRSSRPRSCRLARGDALARMDDARRGGDLRRGANPFRARRSPGSSATPAGSTRSSPTSTTS